MKFTKRSEGIIPMKVDSFGLTIPFSELPDEVVKAIKEFSIEQPSIFINSEEEYIYIYETCIVRADK